MKQLSFVLALVVCAVITTAAFADAVPQLVNYQGKVYQPSGAAVPDGAYKIAFSIYDVPTGGTAIWTETYDALQVKGSAFHVLLGSVNPIGASIFSGAERFLGVKLGTDPELSPRQKIASVPYALVAEKAASATTAASAAEATHAASADIAQTVPDETITAPKIADGAIGATKLSATAITLGYAQIITQFSTSSTTDVQVPGLSATVMIPPGGRSARITVYAGIVNSNNDAGQTNALTIWDGTVGGGTQLNIGRVYGGNISMNSMFVQAITAPSAGTHTYNVGMRVDGSQGNIFAEPTQPAFILVELI